MKHRIILQIVLAGILFGCAEQSQSADTVNPTIVAETETEIVSENTAPHQLEKNDGRKWKISKGMDKPLKRIAKNVKAFDGSSLLEYQMLGSAIDQQTSRVISECNMTGQAHDELHKWLLPFLELQEALVMASSPEEGAAVLENIKTEMEIFDDYFK